MKQLNWSLVKLLIALVVFFNIERLDFSLNSVNNSIDIHSFVYILGGLAVLSTLFVPVLSRSSFSLLATGWSVVFLFFKLLVIDQRPILGGTFTYLTLTEFTFLMLLLYQAKELARVRDEVNQLAEYVALADAGIHLPHLEDAGAKIRREMTRSRYYHRALSVIVVKPEPHSLETAVPRLMEEIQKSVAERCMAVKLADVLGEQLRVVDTVLEDRDNRAFVVLCPEVDAKGTAILSEHIRHAAANHLGLNVDCGVASFPDEAITFESLVAEAYRKLKPIDAAAPLIRHPQPQPDLLQAIGD